MGVYKEDKINYTEVGDVAVMGIGTPLVAISLHTNHFTTKAILECGLFSINMPTADMMQNADYCGIYSGSDSDKSSLYTNSRGKHGTPIIDECPVSIECKVHETVKVENRLIIIADVLETFIDEKYTENVDGKIKPVGMEKLNPLIYSLDNNYYTIGHKIGEGYKEGRKI